MYTEKELGIAATNTVGKLAARVQRDVVVDLLSQVGRNFSNIGAFIREKVRLRVCGAAQVCVIANGYFLTRLPPTARRLRLPTPPISFSHTPAPHAHDANARADRFRGYVR